MLKGSAASLSKSGCSLRSASAESCKKRTNSLSSGKKKQTSKSHKPIILLRRNSSGSVCSRVYKSGNQKVEANPPKCNKSVCIQKSNSTPAKSKGAIANNGCTEESLDEKHRLSESHIECSSSNILRTKVTTIKMELEDTESAPWQGNSDHNCSTAKSYVSNAGPTPFQSGMTFSGNASNNCPPVFQTHHLKPPLSSLDFGMESKRLDYDNTVMKREKEVMQPLPDKQQSHPQSYCDNLSVFTDKLHPQSFHNNRPPHMQSVSIHPAKNIALPHDGNLVPIMERKIVYASDLRSHEQQLFHPVTHSQYESKLNELMPQHPENFNYTNMYHMDNSGCFPLQQGMSQNISRDMGFQQMQPCNSFMPPQIQPNHTHTDDSLTNITWLGQMGVNNFMPVPLERDRKYQERTEKCGRPPYSYMALIQFAINSSSARRMTLRQIYQWIEEKFPYFKTAKPGWKNSIRHNLSLHDIFVREISAGSKASYWTLRDDLNVRPLTLDSVGTGRHSFYDESQHHNHLVQMQTYSDGQKPILPRLPHCSQPYILLPVPLLQACLY